MTLATPQESVLGPVLVIVFINDLHDRMTLSCVADNTKLGAVADIPEGHTAIQKVLSRQEAWVDRNLMKFSNEKCKGFLERKSTDSLSHTPAELS